MTCYRPRRGRRLADGLVEFDVPGIPDRDLVVVPCGRCIGCSQDRVNQWAVRCVHEAKLYERNCFLTLTYDEKHIPDDWSLNRKHFQKFMKSLRKWLTSNRPESEHSVRYFHCGEYGDRFLRPHYHALCFNLDFAFDRKKRQENPYPQWESETLNTLWKRGNVRIGECNAATAAYVAGYVMKKAKTATLEQERYRRLDDTGRVYYVKPEYCTMSRRPGIGRKFLEKHRSDIYERGGLVVTIDGKTYKPPRYYDNIEKERDETFFETVQQARKEKAAKSQHNRTHEKLAIRERRAHDQRRKTNHEQMWSKKQ